MKQNEKDLLVKDLCARLPYGVKVEIYKDEPPYKLKGYDGKDFLSDSGWDYLIEQCKPYLFPMSSMTKEQKKEYAHILAYTSSVEMIQITGESTYDWLNKNMFDWRGLIPMGLANDATGLNIY
jgi:hypothetical protein